VVKRQCMEHCLSEKMYPMLHHIHSPKKIWEVIFQENFAVLFPPVVFCLLWADGSIMSVRQAKSNPFVTATKNCDGPQANLLGWCRARVFTGWASGLKRFENAGGSRKRLKCRGAANVSQREKLLQNRKHSVWASQWKTFNFSSVCPCFLRLSLLFHHRGQ
jgi:hypothetical protein